MRIAQINRFVNRKFHFIVSDEFYQPWAMGGRIDSIVCFRAIIFFSRKIIQRKGKSERLPDEKASGRVHISSSWWALRDSNPGPPGYELSALVVPQYAGVLYNAPEYS